MNAEQLSKVGSNLVRRCGTRDPFQIANALGTGATREPIGNCVNSVMRYARNTGCL
jgi:hypothetical protein